MKYFFIILLLPLQCISQIEQHGTYIFAGICKDGIILATDSRASFADTKGAIGAYYEDCPKIFQYHNLLFAMTGKFTFKKHYFTEIFNKFKSNGIKDTLVFSLLPSLLDFAKKEMIKDDYDSLLTNQFFVCGYWGGMNIIIVSSLNGSDTLTSAGEFRTNNKYDQLKPTIQKNMTMNLKFLTIAENVPILKEGLKEFIERQNSRYLSGYGGELSIATIKRGTVNLISNRNKNYFPTHKVFMQAYKNNEIKIFYRSSSDSISLRNTLLLIESQ